MRIFRSSMFALISVLSMTSVLAQAAATDEDVSHMALSHEVERLINPVLIEKTIITEQPVFSANETSSDPVDESKTDGFGLEITILTSSSLAPELTAALAEEVLRLRPIPVSIVFRGLPIIFKNGNQADLRHDKTESERRLAPLIERGLGAVIDPGVFRRTEKALKQFDASLGSLSLPAILFTTSQGTEIVTGTVSVSWAAGYALARTNDPIWRSEAAEALRKAGIAELVEGAR
ncbi:MAG: hypothetical protein J6K46_03060 [Sutterella sp.]|nr:hypothetical protein [Sutterella sp.]